MPPDLDSALARLQRWQGRSPAITPLTGGLTNRNYRVDVDGESFVLRLSGKDTELLGINRLAERAATAAAAGLGLAPEVVDFIEPEGWLVTRFVPGRPVAPEEMRQPNRIRQVAVALRRAHTLPPLPAAFSPFQVVRDYTRLARERGVTAFPPDFDVLLDHFSAIEAALAREPLPPCPCHNDLLNENFLADETSGRLRLLDWEYAGMGDPFFDLANFAAHHEFADEHEDLLLDAYLGDVMPRDVARLKLLKCASDFREAMWGVVQQGLSRLDFDYRAYADKYFARLRLGLAQPLVPAWLAELSS